jgi:CRP-like cAMP-binding protein
MQNAILRALPRKELRVLQPRLEAVNLPAGMILADTGEPIEYCYFPNSGVTSKLRVMSNGKSVEIGLTGKEGFIGIPLIVGHRSSATRDIVQIAGTGYRIAARHVRGVLARCPHFQRLLHRYAHEFSIQAMQIAACNRLHEVDRQLARWLLMTQDRMQQPTVPLTQELISYLLGSRRATVTEAAGILQKNGLITYSRGRLTIENRQGLEAASCECYQGMNRQLKKWRNEYERGA